MRGLLRASERHPQFIQSNLCRKTNMYMNATPSLPDDLANEARHLLITARDHIAQSLTDDLGALATAAASVAPTDHPTEFPEGTPSWLVIAALESVMPDGSVCWDIARAHITNATASRLAYAIAQDASQELKEATGGAACYALSLALGVSLYEFAGEVWASMGAVPAMKEAA